MPQPPLRLSSEVTSMRENAFPWRLLSEPALAVHATGARPAWLWSTDGRRLLWANPGGALIFGAETCAAASGRSFDTTHPAATQIAAIAGGLPVSGAPRLERLRGFGGRLGQRLTCICARVSCGDEPAILVTAAEPAGPHLSLAERVRRLFDGCGEPVAVYSVHGELLFASTDASPPIADAPRYPEQALKLGEGDSEVRYVRLPRPVPAVDIPAAANEQPADTTDLIDLSPIAQAISEAQKVMAMERAAQCPADSSAHPAAAESDEKAVPADAVTRTQPVTQSSPERRHPVRFVWAIDADNRFSIEPGDFLEAIGPKIATELNRPWVSIAADLALDPDGEVARAIASRDTWSGISVEWPADGSDERLTVELAGLPVYDRDRSFRGYRGFGVCRDAARIHTLIAQRKQQSAAAEEAKPATPPAAASPDTAPARPALSLVPVSENVVPFRPLSNDNRPATLNSVEENAFQELATRLSARLKGADQVARGETKSAAPDEKLEEDPAPTKELTESRFTRAPQQKEQATSKQDRPLLDLLPVGVLIYRHEQFFYANRAFLRWSGHDSVQDLPRPAGSTRCLSNRKRTTRIRHCASPRPTTRRHR